MNLDLFPSNAVTQRAARVCTSGVHALLSSTAMSPLASIGRVLETAAAGQESGTALEMVGIALNRRLLQLRTARFGNGNCRDD